MSRRSRTPRHDVSAFGNTKGHDVSPSSTTRSPARCRRSAKAPACDNAAGCAGGFPGGGGGISGPSAGIYSLAFRDARTGIAVGGDYTAETAAPDGSAVTRDGGRRWTVSKKVPGEYRSGAAWTGWGRTALAVGPTGSDISYDGGVTWRRFDTGSFDAVACAGDGSCWASGRDGRIARLSWR